LSHPNISLATFRPITVSRNSFGGYVLQDEDMDEQQEMERKLCFVAESEPFCAS
jgi:hypothetical protein